MPSDFAPSSSTRFGHPRFVHQTHPLAVRHLGEHIATITHSAFFEWTREGRLVESADFAAIDLGEAAAIGLAVVAKAPFVTFEDETIAARLDRGWKKLDVLGARMAVVGPRDHTVAVVIGDETLQLLDLSGEPVARVALPSAVDTVVGCDGRIVVGTRDGPFLWDPSAGDLVHYPCAGPVTHIEPHPRRSLVAFRVREALSNDRPMRFTTAAGGSVTVAGGAGVEVWNFDTGAAHTIHTQESIERFSWSSDALVLITRGFDENERHVQHIEVRPDEEVSRARARFRWPAPPGFTEDTDLSEDGVLVAIGTACDVVQITDLSTGETDLPPKAPGALQFTNDGWLHGDCGRRFGAVTGETHAWTRALARDVDRPVLVSRDGGRAVLPRPLGVVTLAEPSRVIALEGRRPAVWGRGSRIWYLSKNNEPGLNPPAAELIEHDLEAKTQRALPRLPEGFRSGSLVFDQKTDAPAAISWDRIAFLIDDAWSVVQLDVGGEIVVGTQVIVVADTRRGRVVVMDRDTHDELWFREVWLASLAIGESHGLLAVGCVDGSIECCDLRTGDRRGRLEHAPGSGVRALAFDPRAPRLASSADDGTVAVWTLPTTGALLLDRR